MCIFRELSWQDLYLGRYFCALDIRTSDRSFGGAVYIHTLSFTVLRLVLRVRACIIRRRSFFLGPGPRFRLFVWNLFVFE